MSSAARNAPPMHETGPFVSLTEWDRDWSRREETYELLDGHLLMTPSESFANADAAAALLLALRPRLGPRWAVLQHFDVHVGSHGDRHTIRTPDLVVVRRDAIGRGDRRVNAHHVLLVVEILSPSTEHTDLREKRAEYATAQIPHYVVIDVRNQPTVRHLADPVGGDYRSDVGGPLVTLHLDGHDITIRADDLVL